jgi:uncharacterized membrane protein
MSGTEPTLESLPDDPTFPPSVYERTARLLRAGVLVFFLLAVVGMIAALAQNPSETVSTLLSSTPAVGFGSFGSLWARLVVLEPTAIITLGIYVMVAVTIARVVYAMVDFYRGRERVLAALSGCVVVLLIVGLFVVAPFVH